MKIDLETSEAEIKSVYSPSHETEIKRHGKRRVVVGLEKKNMATDADFLLYYSLKDKGGSDIDLSVLTHKEDKEDEEGISCSCSIRGHGTTRVRLSRRTWFSSLIRPVR